MLCNRRESASRDGAFLIGAASASDLRGCGFRRIPSEELASIGPQRHLKTEHILSGLVIIFFIPPTRNIRVNILPAGFMPAGEMRQRGEDTLSQLPPSSSAGCLSRGRERRGGGGEGKRGSGSRPINLPVR